MELRLHMEMDNREVHICDNDFDGTFDTVISTIQEVLLAMGYHANTISDAFAEEYNLCLENSNYKGCDNDCPCSSAE